MPADDAGDHAASSKGGSVLIVNVAHSFYGATYLFETIGDNLGGIAHIKCLSLFIASGFNQVFLFFFGSFISMRQFIILLVIFI